jgi:putative GTP pyrophosphokinase
MPELHARDNADSIERVLAEFDRQHDHFDDICKTTQNLAERILEHESLQVHSVQARVKRREKIDSKYRNPEKDYRCLSDMVDVVGLRITTYYSDEIDRVAAILKREFHRIREDDKRVGKTGEFGYSALHLDCKYLPSRLQQAEYKRFGDSKFEIQVTTVLGHAWAEMHHAPYDDKRSSPSDEQRAFHRLAAVLELADKEFLEIRRAREARQRNASVRVAAMASIEVSPESLKAFIDETAMVGTLEEEFATMFGRELEPNAKLSGTVRLALLVGSSGFKTVQDLENSLAANKGALTEYMRRCVPIWAESFPEEASRKLSRGLSIYHLCLLLAGAKGRASLFELFERADRKISPSLDVNAQILVAQEVAAKYGLT